MQTVIGANNPVSPSKDIPLLIYNFGPGFGHGSVTVLATIAGMPQSSLILID